MTRAGDGFTLIETLVAMTVLAVAATGLVRATAGHVDLVGHVEARVAGGWAVDNALVEARLGLTPAPASLLGREWRPGIIATGSDSPDIAALTVTATSGDASASMRGFRDIAAPPAVRAP